MSARARDRDRDLEEFREALNELGEALRRAFAEMLERLERFVAGIRAAIEPPPPPPVVGAPLTVYRIVHRDLARSTHVHLELVEELEERARAAGARLEAELELRVTDPIERFDLTDTYSVTATPGACLLALEGRVAGAA